MEVKEISWIINEECNLSCPHCYVSAGPRKKSDTSPGDIDRMIANIKTVAPETIILSGGEPFLHPRLNRFIERARETARRTVAICTNGTRIEKSQLKEAKAAGADLLSISLEHASEDKLATIRGQGALRRIDENIALIQDQGLHVAIDVTLLKTNVDELESLVRFCVERGIGYIDFSRFKPIGRGKASFEKYFMDNAQYLECLKKVLKLSVDYENRIVIVAHEPLFKILIRQVIESGETAFLGDDKDAIVPALERMHARNMEYGFCRVGTRWLGIVPNGEVSPCPLLYYTGLSIGNVLEKPLREIIDTSPVMRRLVKRRTEKTDCVHNDVCGCCMAHNRAFSGEMEVKDFRCWL